jgi:hypothetical protein
MPSTFNIISSVTVGSTAVANVTLSSIPQTYTDLYLVFSPHTNRTSYINSDMSLSINGSNANILTSAIFSSSTGVNGSTGVQALMQGGYDGLVTNQSLVFGPTSIYFVNYTNSNLKSYGIEFTAEGNTSDMDQARTGFSAGLNSNTAAITSITIAPNSGTNFVQHSSFYLYGISKS